MVLDFRGNDVQVGDTIVYAASHGRATCLHEGVVTKIAPQEFNGYGSREHWDSLPESHRVHVSVTITRCMDNYLWSITDRDASFKRVPNGKTSRTTLLTGRWIKVEA